MTQRDWCQIEDLWVMFLLILALACGEPDERGEVGGGAWSSSGGGPTQSDCEKVWQCLWRECEELYGVDMVAYHECVEDCKDESDSNAEAYDAIHAFDLCMQSPAWCEGC